MGTSDRDDVVQGQAGHLVVMRLAAAGRGEHLAGDRCALVGAELRVRGGGEIISGRRSGRAGGALRGDGVRVDGDLHGVERHGGASAALSYAVDGCAAVAAIDGARAAEVGKGERVHAVAAETVPMRVKRSGWSTIWIKLPSQAAQPRGTKLKATARISPRNWDWSGMEIPS